MAEAEQTFMENNEQQNFSSQDSDQHVLTVDEFDQQNIAGDLHNEYNFPENDSENQSLAGHEKSFEGNEPENNYEMISEQINAENDNEETLDGEQPDQGPDGIGLKQEFPDNEANEIDNAPGNSQVDKKEERVNNLVDVAEEKKWPGWPGESVFRMLVPGQKVGNIIGRKGEFIKKMVEETRARIKVLDGPPGSQERAVCWQFVRLQIYLCRHFSHEALKMRLQRLAWALQVLKTLICLERVGYEYIYQTRKLCTGF